MKKMVVSVLALVFACNMFFGVEMAHAKEYKIGYVDLAKVFDECKKTKASEKDLETKGKAKEAERATMVEELRKLKDEQALLSEKAKAEKQTIIDNKIKVLQEFDTKTRDDLVKERNDMLGLILKDIEKVVAEYSKAAGYDLILNSRMLLYGGTEYDLTNEILTRLNK
ncbi:MAG: OmpH family outer membrane protein [Candidatus Omnitrophica bacterium]|nr:OmpH family outer membrane protein [Candidatus Omnitrophota bacterium]